VFTSEAERYSTLWSLSSPIFVSSGTQLGVIISNSAVHSFSRSFRISLIFVLKPKNTMASGGKRSGSGRPKGSGKFGEPTRAIRLPESLIQQLEQMQKKSQEPTVTAVNQPLLTAVVALPLYMVAVSAGLPSSAEDDIEAEIDLNQHLIKNPTSTFLVRTTGDSMIGAGIHSGDVLVVDRSLEPSQSKIVIAVLNGELTVKRICYEHKRVYLMPENPEYPAISVNEGMELQIWGVVTNVIHPV
jgi:DNA polymerase V